MRIRFHDRAEFLEEIRKDAPRVDRGIVRITFSHRQLPEFAGQVQDVFLLAQARIRDDVVVLKRYIGQLGWNSDRDREVHSRIEREGKDLEDLLTVDGQFEIRAGVFE